MFCGEFEVDLVPVVHVFPHVAWEVTSCSYADGKIFCVPGGEPGVAGVHVRWLGLLVEYIVGCGGGESYLVGFRFKVKKSVRCPIPIAYHFVVSFSMLLCMGKYRSTNSPNCRNV